MNRSMPINFKLLPFLQGSAQKRGLIFGGIILCALLAFEIFNFSSTSFALTDVLGDLALVHCAGQPFLRSHFVELILPALPASSHRKKDAMNLPKFGISLPPGSWLQLSMPPSPGGEFP